MDYLQDDDSIAKQFVGAWRMVSWEHQMADGTTRKDPKSAAYFVYSENNHVCYVAMNPRRPLWNSPATPTQEEMMSGWGNNGFYGYCATVEVHARKGFILLRLEVDKTPNMVGATRKRWFKFEGANRLVLRVDPSETSLPIVDSVVVWERA